MTMWLSTLSHLHPKAFIFLSQYMFLIGQLPLELPKLSGLTQFGFG